MSFIIRSPRKLPSPSSTKKNKSIIRKMLSSANRFFTGNKITQKNQSQPPMSQKEEDAFVKRNFQKSHNKELKKELNSYKMMTPAEKEDFKSKFYTKEQLKNNNTEREQNKEIQKLTERLKKLGGKQNKTNKTKKTKNKPKIIIK